MDAKHLKAMQAPLKERYKTHPETAMVTFKTEARLGKDITCRVPGSAVEAGLHPAAGGNGLTACSADMLIQSLAACAGVTLGAVAVAINVPIRDGKVRVEGDLDFRGTLGVSKETPVGLQRIRLSFDLDTDATDEQLATLAKLTERYCVVFQTLRQPPAVDVSVRKTQKVG